MKRQASGPVGAAVVGLVIAACGSGCVMGPAVLESTRLGYNLVIQQSTDEQLLLNLVRLKYREAPMFLEVGSVSAQFSFGQSADLLGTINEGPNPANPDRLGISAGVTYEERPTITFTPLQGKDFVNKLLSPLQLDVVVLLARSGWSIDRVLRMTVQSMNGLDNAASASGPTPQGAPRYERFAQVSRLFRSLQVKGLLELEYEYRDSDASILLPADSVRVPDVINAASEGYHLSPAPDGNNLVLTARRRVLVWRISSQAADQPEVGQIVELLGLEPGRLSYEIHAGGEPRPPLGKGGTGGGGRRTEISIRPRSLMGTLFYLSQGIDVSQGHRDAGLVTDTLDADGTSFDWTRVTGDLLRVHSQPRSPGMAAVSVRHRGLWFYIDDADLNSKSTFALLGQLFALQAGGVVSIAPVLTLPIGG